MVKEQPRSEAPLDPLAGDISIPGTVFLVDSHHVLSIKHSDKDKDLVLVPTPSDHPDDPLNWTPRRKLVFILSMSAYLLVLGLTSAAAFPILVPISEDTGLSLATLNQGTGYMFLLLGWGCLFWQPIALQYGKRPVYLLSLLGLFAVMIWTPYAVTPGQYIGAKIVQGFFGAPVESLVEISLADMSFQHERGKYMGLYALLVSSFNVLGPILMGFVENGQGWRWVFHWCAIFVGVAIIIDFFFMEETNWDREKYIKSASSSRTASVNETKTSVEGVFDGDKIPGHVRAVTVSSNSTGFSQAPRKTYLQKLSVWPQSRPFNLPQLFLRPFYFMSFPLIIWAGFAYGGTLVWFNFIYGTASSFLSSPPYNFSASIVGVSFVSTLVGIILASIWSGKLADTVVLHLTRRNKGIMESEFRLWMFSLLVLITPLGLVLWGVGYAHHVHWFGLIFAMFCLGFQAGGGVSLSVSYLIDSYREIAGEAIITLMLVRNTMAFAIAYAIEPWIEGMGPQNALVLAAVVGTFWCASFLLVIKYGKGLRRRGRGRYERWVEQGRVLGVVH